MHAFHSNWTKPYRIKNPGKKYEMEDFELLTMIISALKWQELNGDIEMVTDQEGASYFKESGLQTLWNGGINEALEKADIEVEACTFWAAGKLYALKEQKTPCVMLDTDFIIWEDLREEMLRHDVTVIHKEKLDSAVYPDVNSFKMDDTYHYPEQWDWTQLPCNTAFTFFKDITFKDYYVDEAMRFMNAAQGMDPLIYMVFAEQRLIAMCAEEKKIDLYAFSTTEELFNRQQKRFTHIWGHKRYLRSRPEARKAFCIRCMSRIQKDYPAFYLRVKEIEKLRAYVN